MEALRLYAVVLRLAALRRGAVPADHGKQALSALYSMLRLGDAQLAETLHDANTHKPFTVSPLRADKRDREGALHFMEGDSAEWRFTLLYDPTFEALVQRYIMDRQMPHVRIGAVDFAVTDAFVSGSHPESGCISLDALTERYSQAPERYGRTLQLSFLTPTAFNLGTDAETRRRRLRVFPEPRTLFSALRKTWVKLGGSDAGDAFDAWVETTIEAEPLFLRWEPVDIERFRVWGFSGRVGYRHWGSDMRWLPYLHLLAHLTFYTGVGYQTTRGLGQVRLIEQKAVENDARD